VPAGTVCFPETIAMLIITQPGDHAPLREQGERDRSHLGQVLDHLADARRGHEILGRAAVPGISLAVVIYHHPFDTRGSGHVALHEVDALDALVDFSTCASVCGAPTYAVATF